MIKTKNSLLENINNTNAFFDILLRIPNDTYLEKILILLKKEIELDFFLMATNAIKNEYEVSKLQLLLDKIVCTSILNTNTLLALYKILSSLHYEYMTLNITKKISILNSSFSLLLYKDMTKDTKEYMIAHISILFLEINKNKHQYKEVLKLFSIDNIFIKQSAVEIVGFIKLSKKESNEIFNIFHKLIEINNINLDKNILSSSNKIRNKHSLFGKVLENYSKDKRSEIKYSISKILLVNKTKDINEDWFKTCLFSLSNINKYEKEVLRNISFILNNIINEKQDYKLIIEFLEEAIKESQIQNNFPIKDFSYFIKNFTQNHKNVFDKFTEEINSSKNADLINLLLLFK